MSCGEEQPQELSYNDIQKPLIDHNKQAAQLESEQIDQFIARRGWDVTNSGTGLRYLIYQEGTGVQAEKGRVARVHFTISLLDGTKCYSSLNEEPQTFLIGRDDVESGLHEGIQHMRVGDKAQLIIPSHLAHGLAGDLHKIPPRSTIIYDIELLGVQ